MSFREQVQQQYSAAIMGLAVSVLLCSILFIGWSLFGSSNSERDEFDRFIYFFDLNTKELIEVPGGTIPPIKTGSGDHQGMPAGVQAQVFCCGPRLKDTELFVGYLETPVSSLPESLRPAGMLEAGPEGEPLFAIRREDDEVWLDPDSPAGFELMRQLRNRCSKELKLTPINPVPRRR